MRRMLSAGLLPFLLIHPLFLPTLAGAQDAAKNIQASQAGVTPASPPLGNRDILEMARANIAPDVIVAKIKSSASDFDTAPAALQRLKEAGVADAVILAMVLAPSSRRVAATEREAARAREASPRRTDVQVPKGLLIEVETAYRVNSQEVREGDAISFRVANPLKVEGVIVVEAGATATARVVKASRGGHFGRAGRLAWSMQEVTAVDGSRIPLELGGRVVGDSKSAKVLTQTAITSVFLGPFALLHGFKRGENAFIPEGKRFEVFVRKASTVSVALPPR